MSAVNVFVLSLLFESCEGLYTVNVYDFLQVWDLKTETLITTLTSGLSHWVRALAIGKNKVCATKIQPKYSKYCLAFQNIGAVLIIV